MFTQSFVNGNQNFFMSVYFQSLFLSLISGKQLPIHLNCKQKSTTRQMMLDKQGDVMEAVRQV